MSFYVVTYWLSLSLSLFNFSQNNLASANSTFISDTFSLRREIGTLVISDHSRPNKSNLCVEDKCHRKMLRTQIGIAYPISNINIFIRDMVQIGVLYPNPNSLNTFRQRRDFIEIYVIFVFIWGLGIVMGLVFIVSVMFVIGYFLAKAGSSVKPPRCYPCWRLVCDFFNPEI